MRRYIVKRILLMLLLLLGMSFIVFASLYIAPGDPATMVAGPSATEADIEAVRASLGLDRPFLVQYLLYLKNLLTLNLGTSYTSRQPILDEILVRLPNTLNLACASMILAVLVGIPCGILTALKKDKLADNILTTSSLVGISIPNFLLGTLLMYVFSVKLGWLPTGGMTHYFWTATGFKQAILPGHRPEHGHHRQLYPHRALGHAGRAPVRLHPHRKKQGTQAENHHSGTRPAQCAHPAGHAVWH